MNVTRCDVCAVTSDAKQIPGKVRVWRSIDVRRAREGWHEWSPGFTNVPGTINLVQEAPDTWPGADRWHNHFGSNSPLTVHFCSMECLLAGLTKLHKGAQIEGYAGFHLRPEALRACLVVQTDLAEEAAVTQEP